MAGMDAQLLAACTGATQPLAQVFAPHFTDGMAAFGITTPMRQAMFLANVGVESRGMSALVESLNYSTQALLAMFSRERISEADAMAFGRNGDHPADQRAIANRIYGGDWGRRNLGNVNPEDGWEFRGRACIQLTGRANATALTAALRGRFPYLDSPNFGSNPSLLAEPKWAALSACWFWDSHGLNAFADRGDFDGVADVVNKGHKTAANGDANGYDDRLKLFNAAKAALGI